MTDDYNENDNYEPNGPVPEWVNILDELTQEAQVNMFVPPLPKRHSNRRKKVRQHKRKWSN